MIRYFDSTPRPPVEGTEAPARDGAGFLYLLGIPLAAGLATAERFDILGFNYTGLMWMFFLVVGALLVLSEKTRPGETPIYFPLKPWLAWCAFLTLSLCWCEPLESRNLQDALQLGMPVLVGVAASLFVRTEEQLDRLLRVFGPAVFLLALCPVLTRLGGFAAMGLTPTNRSLGLTAALAGCVFMARFPERVAGPLFGWGICILLTFVTGSRMATITLLFIPVLHPLYATQLWRVVMILAIAGLGVGLFYSPIFQERFFYEGSGTLTDVLEGDFLSFGRFESWPDIWDEAWRRPWLGAGVGSAYNFVPTVWEDMHHVHNDYLRVGFELGLTGLALFLGVVAWQLYDLRTRIEQSTGVTRTAFAASWLGLLVFLISAFTDNTLGYNLWFTNPLFAVMGAAYGVAGGRSPSSPLSALSSEPMGGLGFDDSRLRGPSHGPLADSGERGAES
jgi:O-antigen ligase